MVPLPHAVLSTILKVCGVYSSTLALGRSWARQIGELEKTEMELEERVQTRTTLDESRHVMRSSQKTTWNTFGTEVGRFLRFESEIGHVIPGYPVKMYPVVF